MISGNFGWEENGRLGFTQERFVHDFLKPEEVGLSIVSEPIKLSLTEELGVVWTAFTDELQVLLAGRSYSEAKLSVDSAQVRRREFRVAIICAGPPSLIAEQVEDQPELVRLSVKVKLLSNVALNSPRAERESGCLAQLARICGPRNVDIKIRRLSVMDQSGYTNLNLTWNQLDLCWEADCKMCFEKSTLSKFGTQEGNFKIFLRHIKYYLRKPGVNNVLQRIFRKCGDNWEIQKEFLETEQFADLEIIGSGSTQTPIKCHKMCLASASPVFAAMLSGSWEEGKSGRIKLPESEDAIRAMLHFIYYGGTERILTDNEELVLQLLEAGHKYQIPSLVDVAAFSLLAEDESADDWLSVDGAVKLFRFARHLEGKVWEDLRKRSFDLVHLVDEKERWESVGYHELRKIAEQIGPGFSQVLEKEWPWTAPKTPCVPNATLAISKQDATFLYDFLSCGEDIGNPRNLDVALGLMTLADFCGRPLADNFETQLLQLLKPSSMTIDVDYVVDLFCLSRGKQETSWKKVTIAAALQLKKLLVEHKDGIVGSQRYWDMIKTNWVAYQEFTSLCS